MVNINGGEKAASVPRGQYVGQSLENSQASYQIRESGCDMCEECNNL